MAATKNVRVAAAFQPGKDPQQDKIIEWLSNLPKDSRGGVKRSVMKYHLTRALLLYSESGLDSKSTLMGEAMAAPARQPVSPREVISSSPALLTPPSPVSQTYSPSVPTLQDRVSSPSPGGLRVFEERSSVVWVKSPKFYGSKMSFQQALARGESIKRAWIDDGVLLSSDLYAFKSGVQVLMLNVLEQRGELFSVLVDGEKWYPSELLKLPEQERKIFCRALLGESDDLKFIFTMRKHGALGHRTVTEASAANDFVKVLHLVQAWKQKA